MRRRWKVLSAAAAGALGLVGAAALHARSRLRSGEAVVRTDERFEFTVRAPLREAFPLFGAWAERAWAGDDWQPRFLHPDPPRDEEGAVFLLDHGHAHQAVWINTAFDAAQGRAQYVYVVPEVQSALINLALTEAPDGASTRVQVRYRRTALDPSMNERVRRLGARDATQAAEWEDAVNRAIETARQP